MTASPMRSDGSCGENCLRNNSVPQTGSESCAFPEVSKFGSQQEGFS